VETAEHVWRYVFLGVLFGLLGLSALVAGSLSLTSRLPRVTAVSVLILWINTTLITVVGLGTNPSVPCLRNIFFPLVRRRREVRKFHGMTIFREAVAGSLSLMSRLPRMTAVSVLILWMKQLSSLSWAWVQSLLGFSPCQPFWLQ
jgi:hypothetical protein